MTIQRVVRFTYVGCEVEGRRLGFDLHSIERIVRAVEISPLAGAPGMVYGTVDYHGTQVPVLNLRHWLGLPGREVVPTDKLILLNTPLGLMGAMADQVFDVVEASELDAVVSGDDPASIATANVLKIKDGLLYIRNVAALLSDDEALSLSSVLGNK